MSVLERAADMLTAYAELIRRDGASRVEEHHYLPEVEHVAGELREMAPPPAPFLPDDAATKPSEPAQEALKVALRMALAAMVKVGGSSEMTPGRYFDELAEPIDAARAALAQIDALSNPRQDESTP